MDNRFFNSYPYTDFHELNLSWVISELRSFATTLEQFVSINALKYADPIQWNITTQYEKNTIVIDPVSGVAYISVAPVPAGVIITNTDYWTPVFDLGALTEKAGRNLTDKYEEETTLTATFPSNINDWIIWGDVLYRVLSPIIAGDQYVVGSNIEHFTIESILGHIEDLNTTDKSNLVAAINEVLTTLANTTGDLDDLNTTDKTNLVAAINEVLQTLINTASDINNTIGDLDDLDTTDKSNLVAAINENRGILDDILPYIGNIVNVLNIGVVPNDRTKAADNTSIINDALTEGKYLFFPNNDYYISAPIVVKNNSGIIGNSSYKTQIICTGDFNGIEVPVSVDDTESITTNVIVTNIGLIGTFSDVYTNTSKGLYLYNYTFNVTCNRDFPTYQGLVGNYALEYRNCIFSHLRVVCFQYGIYTDNMTALMVIKDSFIATNQSAGVCAFGSDCVFENLFITYNFYGMQLKAEAIKVIGCKIYQNGITLNSSQPGTHPSIGLNISTQYARNITLSACEVQENWELGVGLFDGAHDIQFEGVIIDANGFNTTTTDDVGMLCSNVYNITGNITCTDKNTPHTQRLGCYIDTSCHDFNLMYAEHNNVNSIDVAGGYTYRMLKHVSANYYSEGTLNTTYFSHEDLTHAWLYYDGEHLDVHFKIKALSNVPALTLILNMQDIYSHLRANGVSPEKFEFLIPDMTTGNMMHAYTDLNYGIFTGEQFDAGDIFELIWTFRPKYWT